MKLPCLALLLTASCAISELAHEDGDRAKPDQPDAALAQRLMTLRDELGNIPHNALVAAKTAALAVPSALVAGGLDQAKWNAIGPGNIGGRVRAIAIHPTTPTTLFVGSVAGGIWRSTNGGTTWAACDDLMADLAITSIVFTPGIPNVMYAATGEAFSNADSIRGAGIFKSTDGGTTWAQLASTNTSDFYWVARLSFAVDGSALLAATRTAGIWRSTNGGATFTRVYGATNTRCQDVKFHPKLANVAIAHLGDPSTNTSTVVYSTDTGQTWKLATGIATTTSSGVRIELAWHKGYTGASNGCAYAMKETSSTLYRSVDGGASWTQVSTSSILGSQGWYDNALWVNPSDADADPSNDVVIAGGIDLHRSTNGGTSFTKISTWSNWPNSAHADQHTIVEHPAFDGTTNTTAYFGNDGGIWRANNVFTVTSSGWVSLNSGLPITQFYGGSRCPLSGTVIGGTQDNGTLRYTGNANSWSTMYGGDGGFCASNQTNASYHYGEYVYAQVHRSTNGGSSASNIYSGITEAGSGSTALFISPFVLDPNAQTTLYVGCDSLWRSTNATASTSSVTWASVKAPTASAASISAIAIAPGNPNIVWVGHTDGDIWYTNNATAAAPTWTRRDNTSPALPNRYVTRITIDRQNHGHVFATFGSYATDNVWQTIDSGASWVAATGMPSAPVRDVEMHESIPGWLYAATELGLYVSENNGTSWSRGATPANVSIDELFWSSHHLYVVTHGRGMFEQSPYPAPSATSVGTACTLGGPVLGPALASGAPRLGATLTWAFTAGPAAGSAGLYVSAVPPGPTLLSPGCYAQVDLLASVPLGKVALSAAGAGSFQLALPDDPALAGVNVMTQAVALDAALTHIVFTNGVRLGLGY